MLPRVYVGHWASSLLKVSVALKCQILFLQARKNAVALNYAEVIVTFDNADSYLPSEATVVITRRLYRNGDSEFLINGKKVRLKDVHELFTDTGLGRDSFSIISQGKIESIFNSKPEERRAIFEEAAGVLKYKNRKKETESKLSATQEKHGPLRRYHL
jgi:chromosome segregation protein